MRWIAPILSYTADELWQFVPGERGDTVFLESWYEGLFTVDAGGAMDARYWSAVLSVKTAVNKQIEIARKEGSIGGSLESDVVLYCSLELKAILDELQDELRFVLITSSATVCDDQDKSSDAVATDVEGLSLSVAKSSGAKCERCWHHREDVGQSTEHETLCGRCVENVDGDGETRLFA